METAYKIVIFNKRINREIELLEQKPVITVGTEKGCNVRFNREVFFDDFSFVIRNVKGAWQIRCGDTVFLSDSGALKYSSKGLNHGDTYSLRYKSSGQEIFKISFTLNFNVQQHKYDHFIDLTGQRSISFGAGSANDVVLQDALMEEKAAVLVSDGDGWVVRDCGSKYGIYVNEKKVIRESKVRDYDFFSILGYSFYLKGDQLFYDGEYTIQFNKLIPQPVQRVGSCLEYPKFNRNTRLKYVISDEPIPILDPDKKPDKPKSNLLMSLLPAFGSILLILVIRGGMLSGNGSFLSNMSQNSYILFSVASMGLGVVTSIMSIINSKKEYKENTQKRVDVYTKYIETKGKEVDEARKKESALLNDIYYSIEQELEQIREFSGDLFDKTVTDEDYLHVRLGTGSRPAIRKINYKKQERLETNDELMSRPENLYNEFKNVDNVPIVLKLKENNAIGVVGAPDQLYVMMKNIIIDLCVRHYYKDVSLFFILSQEDAKKFYWARWFQNLQNDALHVRNIVCDDESKNNLFEYLYVELSRRETEKVNSPHVVVMVFDDVGIKLHPLSRYIEKAKELGFTFLFFENYKELLPQGCNHIVLLNPDNCSGRLIPVCDVNESLDFSYTTIDDDSALYIAQRSASVYCEEVGLESNLTKNITLYELLNIMTADDLDLSARWAESKVYKSMAAPLGVMRKNEVVSLDLHEKAHGPHGLVAGTTGSGKSEILQSYVLSMATLFHPYEVSFVIIDFKGGGMVNQFKDLPHLIGAITNIDGDEIDRSLLSIKAELLKRQNLFAEANVNHIDAYIKKYKAGEAETPLPHLIIIVDEFAELKADQPEFMKELISAARIGRSLGVHLILATQKPAGQVNEQIWSNSRFKLCLKVQDKSDSNEVLKSPLAAEIKEPGRAYLQVGNNEIFELFQSAYSGASAEMNETGVKNEFTLSIVALSGARSVIFEQKNEKQEKKAETQLQAIVSFVADYCERENIPHLPEICLPSLSEIIEIDTAPVFDDAVVNSLVPIGMYDDPSHQFQGNYSVDLAEDNLMIIGASRFGKTNLLQLIIRSLASRFSPEEVNIYILDFASMVLKNFESLVHVGGVVTASDDEKLKNFIKLINAEIAQRKKQLVSAGVSSFSAYREAGYTDMPQIVIMVDNMTALKEMYFQDDDPILPITREGISVGISCIISNSSTTGIGYRYLANFSSRVALFCNDSGEYANVFESCRKRVKPIPGRALITLNKEVFSCQTYRAFSGEKEIDRVKEMRVFVEMINNKNAGKIAKRIPSIPDQLTFTYIDNTFERNLQSRSIIVGLDYDNVEPVLLDFKSGNEMCIVGHTVDDRKPMIDCIFNAFLHYYIDNPVRVFIIDRVERPLKEKEKIEFVEKYTIDYTVIEDLFDSVMNDIEERYELLMDGDVDKLSKMPMFMFIINNRDAVEYISSNKDLLEMYLRFVKQFKSLGIAFVFTDIDDSSVGYGAPEIYRRLKENKRLLLKGNLAEFKFCELPSGFARKNKSVNEGDAFYLNGSEAGRFKISTD